VLLSFDKGNLEVRMLQALFASRCVALELLRFATANARDEFDMCLASLFRVAQSQSKANALLRALLKPRLRDGRGRDDDDDEDEDEDEEGEEEKKNQKKVAEEAGARTGAEVREAAPFSVFSDLSAPAPAPALTDSSVGASTAALAYPWMAERAFSVYCVVTGEVRDFVKNELGPQLLELLQAYRALESMAPQAADRPLELDNFNVARILQHAERLLDAVEACLPRLPACVRWMLMLLRDAGLSNDQRAEFLASGLFCTVLRAPREFVALYAEPGRVTRTLLDLHARLLFNACTGAHFGTSKALLLDEFLQRREGPFRARFREALDVNLPPVASAYPGADSEPVSQAYDPARLDEALSFLLHFSHTHREPLLKVLPPPPCRRHSSTCVFLRFLLLPPPPPRCFACLV
jgi:hypothetical protein